MIASRPGSTLRQLFSSDSAGGIALMVATALAIAIANSPWGGAYNDLLHRKLAGLTLQHWVNDGLMALFFLLVGLEIKRELLEGQLSRWSDRGLPGVAALGGMVVPALIYAALNMSNGDSLKGWAIPAATDIAFALGVLALLGPRVPASLKLFLTALAILDDLGAILIIALVYTADIDVLALGAAGLAFSLLRILNLLQIERLSIYLAVGALLWLLVLLSGVHATVAGVLLALVIPLRTRSGAGSAKASPLHRLEHALQPIVAFGILPVFAFANAGVAIGDFNLGYVLDNVVLGIAAGLFFGKQIGVFGITYAASRLGFLRCPEGASWSQVYGVAILCGIGFTMSLFIGALAFPGDGALEEKVKVGVLLGSLAAAIAGVIVMVVTCRTQAPRA
jgi:Na+:H+ antiporter, NhaA family